jgi:hypothetical protein
MPMSGADGAGGADATIWMPLTGARIVAVDAAPGVAVSVNPPALMLNFT